MAIFGITRPVRGISMLEAVGSLVTLSLGLAVGFALLHFASAKDTEETAEIVEVPAPQVAAIDQSSTQVTTELEQMKQELIAEFRQQLKQQAQSVSPSPQRTGRAQPAASAALANQSAQQHAQMGQRTLRYWNKLNEIMLQEENMRKVPLGGLTAQNARDFLSRRGKAGQFAAEAIRRLPAEGVDPEVIGQAAEIAAWYDRGTQINGTADYLLNRGSGAERRGQAGETWKEAEQQHNTSVGDLNARGDALRQRMIQKYSLPFPDLR